MASELGVQTIQHTNGTDAMTIDSNGYVKKSQPIVFVGYKDNTTSITSAGIIIWNNVVYDTASAYSTSTGQFTCPVAGYYRVAFHYLFRPTGATRNHRVNVRKNDTKQNTSTASDGSLVYDQSVNLEESFVSASTIVECAANDTLDLHLAYISGGNIYAGTNSHNGMTIEFVG